MKPDLEAKAREIVRKYMFSDFGKIEQLPHEPEPRMYEALLAFAREVAEEAARECDRPFGRPFARAIRRRFGLKGDG